MGDKNQEPAVQFDDETGDIVIRGELGRLVRSAIAESIDGNGATVETPYHNGFCADVLGRVAAAAQDQAQASIPDAGRHTEAA